MKKETVPTHASSLSILDNIDFLVEKISEEIQERAEVAEIAAFFKSVLNTANLFNIKTQLGFENAGKLRKDIAAKQKKLEKEIQVTPKGQTFEAFKGGLHTLHLKVKKIMDNLQADAVTANEKLKGLQNAWLNEQARIQAELKLKAKREAAELELKAEREAAELKLKAKREAAAHQAALQKRIDAAKKEGTKKRLEQEQEETRKRLEQEKEEAAKLLEMQKEQIVTATPQVMPGKVPGVRKVEVVTVEVMNKEKLLKWLINPELTRILIALSDEIEGLNKIETGNSRVTRGLLNLKHMLIQLKRNNNLIGFMNIDLVGLAKHCKQQSLKDGEVPGIKINRRWDSQIGR